MRLLGRRAECDFLDAALADARDGRSRAVVLRGEAGAGKSVLLEYTVGRADRWRVATAVGIESEMELAYSGLDQLCAPMLDHLDSHLFPIQLEPFQCTRFEMADFARRARNLGVDYIGICCGGGPHHVRAMAEALGRKTPASRYSPDLALHPVLGPTADARHEVMGGWSGQM